MHKNKKIEKTKTLSCLVAFSIIMSGVGPLVSGETLTVPTFDEVISGIAAAERSLINVKIEAETFEEERSSSTEQWKPNGVYVRSTAIYNGMPKSKARIDIHSEVLKWEQGLASHAEESYSVGFDGRFGRVARHKTGAVGKMADLKQAEILPDAPDDLRDGWRDLSTGAAFALNFLFNQKGIPASEMLKTTKADPSIKISRETYQDSDCVKISMMDGRRVFWFDLERGYAFRGCDYIRIEEDGRRVVFKASVVTRVVEAAPGIWFPAEAYQLFSPREPNRLENRIVFKASQVIANDPSFNEEVFTVPIPSDYIVFDKVSGITYKKNMYEEKLLQLLDQTVATVMGDSAEVTGLPSEEPEVGNSPVTASKIDVLESEGVPLQKDTVPEGTAVQKGFRILWLFGFLVLIGLASVTVSVVIKKQESAKAVTMLCLLMGCTCVPRLDAATMDADIVMEALRGPKDTEANLNCGLNVAYISLRCVGYVPSFSELTTKLNLNENLTRPLSFMELKNCLEAYGVKVKGLRADTTDEMVELADSNNVLIVHVERRIFGQKADHYLAIKKQGNSVWLIDPPRSLKKYPIKDISSHLKATGNCLVISNLKGRKSSRSSIEIKETEIDLGRIPVTTKKIIGTIRFRNNGNKTLKILHVSGSCSCYGGHSGSTEVEPGEHGEIKVNFIKEKLQGGPNRQIIKIATSDPKNEVVKVEFRFIVQTAPHSSDIRVMPQNIDYGRSYRTKIGKEQINITIWVPEGIGDEIHNFRVSTELEHLNVSLVSNSQEEIKGARMRVGSYLVSWDKPPSDGFFEGEIKFFISGEEVGETVITVPVRGDAI